VHKYLIYAAIFASMVVGRDARAQYTVNTVRVSSNVPDAPFRVDGELYYRVAEFAWPAGSKHFITFLEGDVPTPETRFTFLGWVTNLSEVVGGAAPIIASPDLKSIELHFIAEYQLSINIPECITGGDPCTPPGRIQALPGGTFEHSTKYYVPGDAKVTLSA
jgi:hypothetical protein